MTAPVPTLPLSTFLVGESYKIWSAHMTHQWSCKELKRLPPVIDVPTAASILSISEWTAYEMIRRGDWEANITPVLRLGRKIKIPTARLIDLLCGDAVRDDAAS